MAVPGVDVSQHRNASRSTRKQRNSRADASGPTKIWGPTENISKNLVALARTKCSPLASPSHRATFCLHLTHTSACPTAAAAAAAPPPPPRCRPPPPPPLPPAPAAGAAPPAQAAPGTTSPAEPRWGAGCAAASRQGATGTCRTASGAGGAFCTSPGLGWAGQQEERRKRSGAMDPAPPLLQSPLNQSSGGAWGPGTQQRSSHYLKEPGKSGVRWQCAYTAATGATSLSFL